MQVELLYFDGCPNWQATDKLLRELADVYRFTLTRRLVDTPEEAEAVSFRGSPSVMIDGRDAFGDDNAPVGLACRVYDTPDGPVGEPPRGELERALQQAAARSAQ